MIKLKNTTRLYLLVLIVFFSGCSTNSDEYVYKRSQPRYVPNIPEIATVRVQPPAPRYIPSVKPKVKKPYKPKVQKYSAEQSNNTVITQKEVATATPPTSPDDSEKKWEEEVKKKAEVDTDPYENIPEDSSAEKTKTVSNAPKPVKKPVLGGKKPMKPTAPAERESSSAVKSLLFEARADAALGLTTSAISKLERGLRIEPQNSDLWYSLAKAQYSQKNYTQSVTMAKKSIRYTNRDYAIAKNWILIKKAGLKSGDTVVVKEAIDYFKVNP